MRNNLIAIIVISFIMVGALWGIGNLMNPSRESTSNHERGILLVAQNNAFNETNPNIQVMVNVPKEVTIINKDFVRHDFIVDKLGINTSYLFTGQQFKTAIVATQPGPLEYYCSLHPSMRGKILAIAQ